MEEECEEENVATSHQSVEIALQGQDGSKLLHPPNRKRLDEEMLALTNQITKKEAEMEKMKTNKALHVSKELNLFRAEKSEKISRRKDIDCQLDRINKVIPEKMKNLNQLELSLYYKSEDRINLAVQRLEWNLTVQTFKLSEEKKIVSEIDSLKRSKKILGQYKTLQHEIFGIRDQQRRMRDERDSLFRAVSQIKAKEERLKVNANQVRSQIQQLKKEIDALYETKRLMLSSYGQRKEGIQRWDSGLSDKRKLVTDKDTSGMPFAEEIQLCNTLIAYLGGHGSHSAHESSLESHDDAESTELAEEIDDGQYVLLKKTDSSEGLDYSGGSRKISRRNRRSRKQSMVKQMTHSAEALGQFHTLNVEAPTSTADISETLDKLMEKKAHFESGQACSSPHTMSESASDAGVSATESLMMSRQVSKTESSEGGGRGDTEDQIYADLLRSQENKDLENTFLRRDADECQGAVGGQVVKATTSWDSNEGTGPNSDSTLEGDSGSVESQPSVCEGATAAVGGGDTSLRGVGGAEPSSGSGQGTKEKPTLLYSEMVNLPKPIATTSPRDRHTETQGSSLARHPPLSSSVSSPACFLKSLTSTKDSAGSASPQSQSLDTGYASKLKQGLVAGQQPQARVMSASTNKQISLNRRSTFSGPDKRGGRRGKTAVERRETFSGGRRDGRNNQDRQSQHGDQRGRGYPSGVKRLAVSPQQQQTRVATASTDQSQEESTSMRPRALTLAGSSTNFPPLSASWSGVASGALRSSRSQTSICGPAAGMSYSAAVNLARTPSGSSPSASSLSQLAESPPTQLSPRQHTSLSARVSAPASSTQTMESTSQDNISQRQPVIKSPLGPRASLPITPHSKISPQPQAASADPYQHTPAVSSFLSRKNMGPGRILSRLASQEEIDDFPPLSLSASLPNPPRRNSTASTSTSRSANSSGINMLSQLSPFESQEHLSTSNASPALVHQNLQHMSVSSRADTVSASTVSAANTCHTKGKSNTGTLTKDMAMLSVHQISNLNQLTSVTDPISIPGRNQPPLNTQVALSSTSGFSVDTAPFNSAAKTPSFTTCLADEPSTSVPVSTILPTDTSFTERWVQSSSFSAMSLEIEDSSVEATEEEGQCTKL